MITLIRGGEVFAPEPLGRKDVLIAGGGIEAVAEPGRLGVEGCGGEVVDATGRRVLPGLIDPHVHILGGGGEGGPATRAPEIRVEDIAACGVTTVVGCLGTDGITRHMTSLLAKARALEIEGVSAYVFSGSYDVPVRTLTGSVRSDLVLIDKVIGAGEIALSDHRSSQPTFDEIARLAAECRVGGLLGGKAGILHCHLGDGRRGLEFLFRLVRETEIPVTQVVPTHVTRNAGLFDQALDWAAAGGAVDITVGTDPAPGEPDVRFEDALEAFARRGLPLTRITASSDGNGSMPVFDAEGRLVRLAIATERDFLRKFREIVRTGGLPLEAALRLFATNAAEIYKLGRKGRIEPGRDADLLVVDGDLGLVDVFARGRRLMAGGKLLARGTFSA
ncbi:MAG TPA: beta-aspartyl-peptidase [Candidatus Aminicenantes bacterium]|nr:beta-aspartyl-peptidase [Candidatus Aminicenantes bacterium]HRY66348.1 beta-aspartyl-peptidase [Candidatus Aminicenantes bacterium]HRZ73275.1 beta-aspartyl-peptidase [Candidatus Aminicenantes bacterium]